MKQEDKKKLRKIINHSAKMEHKTDKKYIVEQLEQDSAEAKLQKFKKSHKSKKLPVKKDNYDIKLQKFKEKYCKDFLQRKKQQKTISTTR